MRKVVWLLVFCALFPRVVSGVPYFARKFNKTCQSCHLFPPQLNQFGLDFVARGYRLEGVPAKSTLPFSVWVTQRLEVND